MSRYPTREMLVGSILCACVLLGLVLLPKEVYAVETWYPWKTPKGDFTKDTGNLKSIDGTYYCIYAGNSEQFTARYNDLHPSWEDVTDGADYRGDPECSDEGNTAWGGFESPAVQWTFDKGTPATSNAVSPTWTAPSAPSGGAFDIILKVDDAASNKADDGEWLQIASIKVYCLKVVQSGVTGDNNLWYFNGENATNYNELVTLTAEGSTTGYFHWEVDAGVGKVKLNNGGADLDEIGEADDNTVDVKSHTAGSASENDVTVRFSFGTNSGNTQVLKDHTLTVYWPYKLVRLAGSDTHTGYFGGWQSKIYYKIEDRLGSVLPRNVELNEDWTGGVTSDWEGENWSRPTAGDATVSPSSWYDDCAEPDDASHNPHPTNPETPLGSDEVQNWPGEWNVGSTSNGQGVQVQTNTWQDYLDHHMHTGITSPP